MAVNKRKIIFILLLSILMCLSAVSIVFGATGKGNASEGGSKDLKTKIRYDDTGVQGGFSTCDESKDNAFKVPATYGEALDSDNNSEIHIISNPGDKSKLEEARKHTDAALGQDWDKYVYITSTSSSPAQFLVRNAFIYQNETGGIGKKRIDVLYTMRDATQAVDPARYPGVGAAVMQAEDVNPNMNILGFKDVKVDVEFFEAKSVNTTTGKGGKPVEVCTNMTYWDVDCSQAVKISGTNIKYAVVTKNSNLDLLTDIDDISHTAEFRQSSTAHHENETIDKDAFGVYLGPDSKFTITYTTGRTANGVPEGGTHSKYKNNGCGTYTFIGASDLPLARPTVPRPKKLVKDADEGQEVEINGEKYIFPSDSDDPIGTAGENRYATLESTSSTFTFDIWQRTSSIKPENSVWYYDKFIVKDTLPDGVIVNKEDIKVYISGNDRTSDFTPNMNNNLITVTAKSSILNSQDLYGKNVHIRFKAKLDKEYLKTIKTDYVPNSNEIGCWTKPSNGKFNHATYDYAVKDDLPTNWPYYVIPNKATVEVDDFGEQSTFVSAVLAPLDKPKLVEPNKDVINSLGNRANSREIGKVDREYKYVVRQQIREGYHPSFYFKSFELRDTVEDYLIPSNPKVVRYPWTKDSEGDRNPDYTYNNGEGEDVSNKFEIKFLDNNKTISATLKNTSDSDFYDREGGGWYYELQFTAKMDANRVDTAKEIANITTTRAYTGNDNESLHPSQKLLQSDGKTILWPNQGSRIASDLTDTDTKKTDVATVKYQFLEPEAPSISKTVTDGDRMTESGPNTGSEVRVTQNTLEKADNTYTYELDVRVNKAYAPAWYFNKFIIKDTIEDILVFTGTPKVEALDKNKSVVRDVTSLFNISTSGKNIAAAAKSDTLSSPDFHDVYKEYTGSTPSEEGYYRLTFQVKIDTDNYDLVEAKNKIDKWLQSDKLSVKIPNVGSLEAATAGGDRSKTSNTVNTIVHFPTFDDPKTQPGLKITKTTHPYEFQVGDEIPYTLTIEHTNPKSVAYKVLMKDVDFPKGFTIDESSFKAELTGTPVGTTRAKAFDGKLVKEKGSGGDGFSFTSTYLYCGEKITITFKGKADKTLNGKIVPNVADARSWGVPWKHADTSVYINSPKVNITKEIRNPNDEYKTGDVLKFVTTIKNDNPGTFLRNLYAIDTSETKGLEFKPSTVTVRYKNPRNEKWVDLDKGDRTWKIATYTEGENEIPLDNLGFTLGSKNIQDYQVKTATKEANTQAEETKGTGSVLPEGSHGGFLIKFFGNYRNLGDATRSVPATTDKRGKTAKYLTNELKAIESANGTACTTDYENLNLQSEFEITYDMVIEDETLVGKEISNFIRVPSTENTNNDFIHDNDDLHVKGSPKVGSGGDYARFNISIGQEGDPDKKVQQTEVTEQNATLNYTIEGQNNGTEVIVDPVLEDKVITKNALVNKDSVKVYLGNPGNDNEITDKCNITFDDAEYKFVIKVNDFKLRAGQKIVAEYTATVNKDLKKHPTETDVKKLTAEYVVDNEVTFLGKSSHTYTTYNPNPPAIKVTKSVNEVVTSPGSTLNYTVKGENTSQKLAQQVVFKDDVKTKNFDYNRDSMKIVFTDKNTEDHDITEQCEIEYTDDTFTVNTKQDIDVGEYITITYSGKVREVEGAENVHNVVEMNALKCEPSRDKATVIFGSTEPKKEPQVPNTYPGRVIPYVATFINTDDDVWRDFTINDEITSKNAIYNKDFKIMLAGEDITSECNIEYGDYSVKISTGRDLIKGKGVELTYSVTAEGWDWVDNAIEYLDPLNKRSTTAKAYVPPVTHEKSVKEQEHDGPNGKRNTLHYTITTKHNGTYRPIKNAVITDKIYSSNMTYEGDIKVYLAKNTAPEDSSIESMEDITNDCNISVSEDKMSFEIKLGRDFEPGDVIKTVYEGKVADKNKVDNLTTFYADNVNEITDDEHVPGPGEGHYVTVYKDSDPVTETKVEGGDTITYTLKAVNSGDELAEFTHIRDYIPAGTTFKSVDDEGAYVSDGNYVEWVVKDIEPGKEKSVKFSVTVNEEPLPKDIYNHALYEEKTEDPGNPGEIQGDPQLKTRYVHHFTEKGEKDEPRVNLLGVKSCEPESGTEVDVDNEIKYFIELTNRGGKDTTTAGIRDYIPEGTEFVSVDNDGKYNEQKNCVDWEGLTVKAGDTIKVGFTVKVTEEAKAKMRVENQALYQDEWDAEIDPANSTNIVVHPLKPIEKTSSVVSTKKGEIIPYTVTYTVNRRSTIKDVKFIDEIKTKNAKYNNDFKVKVNGVDVESTSEVNGYTATVSVGMNLEPLDKVELTYTVTTETNAKVINEVYEIDRKGRTDSVELEIPYIDHIKDVKEEQHDGPEGQINVLNYTLTSINDSSKPLENVVITDEIMSKNMDYNKDIKVVFDGQDITSECKISYEDNSFRIETGKSLSAGGKAITTYSGTVKDRAIVSNETVLTADGIDGIYDWEHVPGPEDGVYVTTRKTSEPPSGTVVKSGETITYILTATNSGKDISKFTQIRDTIPKGTTFKSVEDSGVYVEDGNYCEWVVSELKPNESKAVKFTVTVNEDAPKEIWNVAYYRTYPENPGDPGKIPVAPDKKTEETVHYTTEDHDSHVLLRAIKSAEPRSGKYVKVGEEVRYTIGLKNYGDKDTETAGIRDYIPENTEFVSVEDGGTYNKEKNCVEWKNLSIKAGEEATVQFTIKVLDTAVSVGKIENQAMYQNDWEGNKDPSSTTNIVEHPVAPKEPELIRGKQVTLYKGSDPAPNTYVETGQTITYILTAKNTGAETSKYTRIRDYIPVGTTYASVQDGGVYNKDKNYVEWVVKDIPVGGEKKVTFKVTVNDNAPRLIRNFGLHETTDGDPDTPGTLDADPKYPSNPIEHKTEKKIKTSPIIEVIKGSTPKHGSPVQTGDTITYRLNVKNSGESTAKSIVVRDAIPKGTSYVEDSADNGGSMKFNKLQWVIDSLEGGKDVTVSFKVKVTAKNFRLIENQAIYDMDFDPNDPSDPKNWSNIVEHPTNPLTHTKNVKEKFTRQNKDLHYGLITTAKFDLKNVVIKDTVTSKNISENKDVTVQLNGKDITNKVKIKYSKYGFTINAGNIKKGDVLVTTYSVKALNNKNVENTSIARADNVKEVKAKNIVRVKLLVPAKVKVPATGDNTSIVLLLVLSCISAILYVYSRKIRKN